MKSPFPGMDPYIEACGLWEDFHNHLIESIHQRLAEAAPDRYLVRTGERSYVVLVESEGQKKHSFVADLSVTAPRGRKKPGKKGTVAVAEAAQAEPVEMRAFIAGEHCEAFVEIYDTDPEQQLVTTVEVLSPTNKRPKTAGRRLYLRKRRSMFLGDVNLVEIDLLRGGQRMPMLDPWPESPYALLVAWGTRTICKAWPAHFQRPLPTIPVPLAKPDPDISLNLQPMIEAIYQRSRYERSIDYTQPLTPPLNPEEAAWLKRQLQARKGRT